MIESRIFDCPACGNDRLISITTDRDRRGSHTWWFCAGERGCESWLALKGDPASLVIMDPLELSSLFSRTG